MPQFPFSSSAGDHVPLQLPQDNRGQLSNTVLKKGHSVRTSKKTQHFTIVTMNCLTLLD
jgi:hypothetical protein